VSDDRRALWEQHRRDGKHAVISGLTQVAMSVPIMIVGGLLSVLGGGKYAIVIAMITLSLSIAAIGRGGLRIIRGSLKSARATRELADLQRGQLPEARVIDR
jgi:hypothetical protein